MTKQISTKLIMVWWVHWEFEFEIRKNYFLFFPVEFCNHRVGSVGSKLLRLTRVLEIFDTEIHVNKNKTEKKDHS